MTERHYDIIAERIVGRVARHARHNCSANVLQNAKSIAYIFAEEMYPIESTEYQMLNDAIARICPEAKCQAEAKEYLEKTYPILFPTAIEQPVT